MSETAKALGLGNTLQIDGKTYELTPFTWRMRALFERWLKNQAWREVEETRESCDPLTYKARHDAMTALIGAQYYKAGNLGFQQAMQSIDGIIHQTYLMLQPKHPEVTQEMVESWYESQYAVDLAAKIAEMERDPQEDSDPNEQPAKA